VARPRRARPPGTAAAVHEARAGRQPGRVRPGGGALQRGRGPHRLFHRHRRHAGTGQERAQRRHLRARHVPQSPAQLHGPGMRVIAVSSVRWQGGGRTRAYFIFSI